MGEAELLAAYGRAQRRRALSPETTRRSGYTLGAVASFLATRGLSLLTARRQDLEDWLDSRNVGSSTRYWHISMLASFYRWAIREELTDRDPTAAIDRPKLPRRLPRPIGDDDLTTAIERADARMRCWLLLGAYEGTRASEIAGLERSDVLDTWDPPMLRVLKGKGRKPRLVPLHADVLNALHAYGMRSGPLWLGQRGPLRPATIIRYVSRYLHGLGIDATSHRNRHWFGTKTYRRSKDLLLVRDLMGHEDQSTTAIYTLVDPGDAVGVVQSLQLVRREEAPPPAGDGASGDSVRIA